MKNYAFIDSNNLYVGSRKQGIKIDYRQLRLYLKQRFGVEKAFLFIGYNPKYEEMYKNYEKMGYICIFKPTIIYRQNGCEKMKGNVDAELVLHSAAIEYENYDQAVIISGDGDFACLMKYLQENNKLNQIIVPSPHFSTLLKDFHQKIVGLHEIKKKIQLKQKD